MNHRDATIEIECILCGRVFTIQVNKEDYEKFSENDLQEIEMEQLFPYLNDEEANLLVTQVCENCV
jgi:hypothetical protein